MYTSASPYSFVVFFFGRSLPNLFTHQPTPGFLWDLGERKVKFGLKRAIFGVIWGGFEGFGPCCGNQPPHPPTFGRERSPKKTFFSYLPLLLFNKSLSQSSLESWLILKNIVCRLEKDLFWCPKFWSFEFPDKSQNHNSFILPLVIIATCNHCHFFTIMIVISIETLCEREKFPW